MTTESEATGMSTLKTHAINNFDAEQLRGVMVNVARNPAAGRAKFHVTTDWLGGTQTNTRVDSYELGGHEIDRHFEIPTDEPTELLGTNTHANPQEVLMAGFNACMMVGYVTGSSMAGITLERIEIETEGELDLRGFLGIDKSVTPGYDEISYTVRIKGDASPEQFRKIHETVMASSPNRWNLSHPVTLKSYLVVE